MVDALSGPPGAQPGDDGWSTWPAPAKLNLFLHVTGRRPDGYHELQTVFQLLDRGDSVRLRPRTDGTIRRLDPLPGVPEEADLAVRAAAALREATGVRSGVDIAVDKQIPLGGGLGGGSSDAATVLVALDALWKLDLGAERLAALGLRLGADVPLFVHGRSAWAEGIGECLTPLALPSRWYIVVDPGVRVPTAALYQVAELTRDSPRLTIPRFVSGEPAVNVFEPVVRARFPAVARALDWLGSHAPARLSGSGGCVFAAVASGREGMELVAQCPSGMRAFVARGVDESPLHSRLREARGPHRVHGWGVAKR